MSISIQIDGGCRGNPGPSSAGIWVPELDLRLGYYLGNYKTNNEAEYSALILSFLHAKECGWDHLYIFSDSKLMVEQMKGVFAVKAEKIIPLHRMATELEVSFSTVTYTHVKREFNKEADKICNEVLDKVAAGEDVAVTQLNVVQTNLCVGVLTLDNLPW